MLAILSLQMLFLNYSIFSSLVAYNLIERCKSVKIRPISIHAGSASTISDFHLMQHNFVLHYAHSFSVNVNELWNEYAHNCVEIRIHSLGGTCGRRRKLLYIWEFPSKSLHWKHYGNSVARGFVGSNTFSL